DGRSPALPSAGVTSASSDTRWDRVTHLVLPAVALATTILPTVVRFTRSSTVEVLHEDYVRTAASKGLAPGVVIRRHALRNALIPVTSAVGALVRSEEHTSELQSRVDLVCRLLLEKK